MSSQANAKISRPGGSVTELVARAAAGDRDAFATLYNEFRPQVFTYLDRRTMNRPLAEDLTQDVFLRALSRLETFHAERGGGFGAWLMTIARNIHLDYTRSARFRLEIPVGQIRDVDESVLSAELTALRELDIVEAVQTTVVALKSLTVSQRECVRLRFVEGLSFPEIAIRMHKNLSATKTLQFRAVHTMRRVLTDQAVSA
ncbi:hypothetical protein GCM10010372_31080 [Streptomyces tauricus]|uniref:RNA polymerase sigma factor n=1 Tax=Streptomyces tauricus TaxID=68274 RepID=UPI001679A0D6|nr:RNA polymerase sigma factor [Streptomyces tauricus]GHA28970.1 hypothetical protein GCM10010372_31080 [Streptomyces tauricus]